MSNLNFQKGFIAPLVIAAVLILIAGGIYMFSISMVKISAPNSTPSITVFSPNGGEIYNVTDELVIRWWDDSDAGNKDIYITDLQHFANNNHKEGNGLSAG